MHWISKPLFQSVFSKKTFSDCFHFPPLTISRYWHSCFSLLLNLGQMASPKKYQSVILQIIGRICFRKFEPCRKESFFLNPSTNFCPLKRNQERLRFRRMCALSRTQYTTWQQSVIISHITQGRAENKNDISGKKTKLPKICGAEKMIHRKSWLAPEGW